jgi:hypothetical protein
LEGLEQRIVPAWIDADLSLLGSGPHAASAQSGYVTPDGFARVVYNDANGDVHELALNLQNQAQSWVDGDISALGSGPHAGSAPFGYVTPDGFARVVYDGAADGHVHELALNLQNQAQGWMDADLSALGGGPQAASAPSGYVTFDGNARVVYMGADSDVHELHLTPGPEPVPPVDPTIHPSALPAPSGGVTPDSIPAVSNGGNNWEIYELGPESGSTTHSGTRLAEALTDGLSGSYSAQGLSWRPASLPLEGLDAFYELFGN